MMESEAAEPRSKSESLTLSLVENGREGQQPLPLNIRFPESTLRRSPRFTTDPETKNVGSNSSNSHSRKAQQNGLRRSPRFSPVSSAETASQKVSGSKDGGEKVLVRLRRSPRLRNGSVEMFVSEKRDSGKKKGSEKGNNGLENCEEKVFGERAVRRSPRFSSASDSVQNDKLEMGLALVESQISTSQSLAMQQGYEDNKSHIEFLNKKLFSTSPRLSSLQSETESSDSKAIAQMTLSPMLGSSEKVTSSLVSLRNSDPKLLASKEVEAQPLFLQYHRDGEKESFATIYVDSRLSSEKQLRRSPRFILESENGLNNESFIKPTTKLSDEMQLRSEGHLLPSNEGDSIKLNSDVLRLSNLSNKQPSKKARTFPENFDSDLGISDEKFSIRSPRTMSSSFGRENGIMIKKCTSFDLPVSAKQHSPSKKSGKKHTSLPIKPPSAGNKQKNHNKRKNTYLLIGDPIPNDEAQERWRWRYEIKDQRSKDQRRKLDNDDDGDDDDEDKIVWNVECHYTQAKINDCIFDLGDCVYIKGDRGQKHVGRIVEFFKTTDGEDYFRVQWFYRAEDTVMKEEAAFHDKNRLFYSTVMNDNPINCIISKVSIVHKSPMIGSKMHSVPSSDFYFDMKYCVDYSTFQTIQIDNSFRRHDSSSSSSDLMETVSTTATNTSLENLPSCGSYRTELLLLDLFSGCGGMSTGLCLGAKLSCVDLVTRWALDSDKSACESLKLNHPGTHVRNEAAEDFLELLKEWQKLCKRYPLTDAERFHKSRSRTSEVAKKTENSGDDDIPSGEYEVSRLVDICYGDPDETGKRGLKFKVHWKGYNTSEDTWEPIEGLSNCQECIQEFVRNGIKSKILPLPGEVDVICGGPPCQGISGYNRFRNVDSPLADERNRQIVVFMDIVQFLKPKFVLMENVVDILRFDKASLGRYALSRLVHMKYQARLGTIAAGCYGLPQFRLRVFLWGAHPNEKLPQFPLPTHDVIIRYWPPPEFERNTVAYDEDQPREVEKATVLQDAISDLPAVTTHESREAMPYEKPPETDFQRFIRSTENEMTGSAKSDKTRIASLLYDHRPYTLTEDDCVRVGLIPKRKGANFRDLPGVVVGADNIARRDLTKKQVPLPSGKPLVPDFAFTFEGGKSKRPYARLWWDETVSTVVTYPGLHSQVILHPEQDRVLTIRECARLQGFPDYYRFCGTIKERYRQIGNAVAVPVARALGYALGMAFQKLSGDEPLMTLPPKFSHSTNLELAEIMMEKK